MGPASGRILEFDTQVVKIHILMVVADEAVAIQKVVAHTSGTNQEGTVAAIQREVAVVQKKKGELRESKTLEKTPETYLS